MVKYSGEQLDAVFAALADSTRRGILESLSGGAHEAGRGLDLALREVLDREARCARALPVPARGAADMEQARLKDKPSLGLTRSYPIVPEKVWRAWTDPQALKRWWGPGGVQPVSLAPAGLERVVHQA